MNVIFKTGVIATLILVSVIGIHFKQTSTNRKDSIWLLLKNYFLLLITQLRRFLGIVRNNDVLKNRVAIVPNIFLLSTLVVIKILHPEVFYYALPCILFFLLLLNMDKLLKIRKNPDFVGEAAIGYLIFISYLLFIILFLFLITIYFRDTDTLFLFI